MHAFTHDKCTMGVWHQRIPQSPLGLCGPEPLTFIGPANYRAPTWSWAAYDGEVQFPAWAWNNHGKSLVAEYSSAMFVCTQEDMRPEGTLSGLTSLAIKGTRMLRNVYIEGGKPGCGTGLRLMNGQRGKPSWMQAYNWEPVKTETRFWTVHDDSGKQIGWGALDNDERDEIDGETESITAVAIASYTDDNRARGLLRGKLVLFVKRLMNVWMRVGMGQIDKADGFEVIEPTNVIIL
jgi:hypothetical protein